MASLTAGQRLGAELLGTAFLLATVVGSGIMGERLSDGNEALALLGNALATGAMLVVLLTALGPVSGPHLNPAVTAVFLLRREIEARQAAGFVAVQVVGALVGTWVAHAMFDETLMQLSTKVRSGPSQWFAELVAAFGLVATILLTKRVKAASVAVAVGLYITAAYWFTASTSFANPAVTIARAFTDTFAGIRPADVAPFIAAQMVGAVAAHRVCRMLTGEPSRAAQPADKLPTE
ncbi:MAG TPA: MIP/aquaporin family protein [Hyphomicrobiaceae bacterium]|nr:MIP/aquaporin family protein [Hyphomicrobiaceae bacterium]